ncbi:MAG: hypothetical protein QM754_16285 [Tepidisphaeraceae bacterium]
MLIKDLFERDIARDINGVVKADQTDAKTVWQELEEFVVTKELDRQFRLFFSAYADGAVPAEHRRVGLRLLRQRQVAPHQDSVVPAA